MVLDANWQRPKAIPDGVVVEHTLLMTRRRPRQQTTNYNEQGNGDEK